MTIRCLSVSNAIIILHQVSKMAVFSSVCENSKVHCMFIHERKHIKIKTLCNVSMVKASVAFRVKYTFLSAVLQKHASDTVRCHGSEVLCPRLGNLFSMNFLLLNVMYLEYSHCDT